MSQLFYGKDPLSARNGTDKKAVFKRLQQAAPSSILVPVRPRHAILNGKLLVGGRIQTASETPNKRGRVRAYTHALALPVGWVWRLPQPGPWALCRILMHFACIAYRVGNIL